MAQTDLFFLLVYVLRRREVEDSQYILDRCREYQADPFGYIDLWARGHYKSSIITFADTIRQILTEPELTHCIFSHTRDIAKDFLMQIKRELEDNELLKLLFPDVLYTRPEKQSPQWNDEGIVIKRNGNPKEATVEAWGVIERQPTGRHFNRLTYDDLVTIDTVQTPDQNKKCYTRFLMSLNLVATDNKKRMIGTFYAHNDPYTRIIKDGTFKPRIHTAMSDKNDFNTGFFMSAEELMEKMRSMGADVFSTQMMLDPSVQSGQVFRTEWLRYWDVDMAAARKMNLYLLVDPASSQKKNSDFTDMKVVGLNEDGKMYVCDIVHDRLNLTQRAEALFRLHRKWKPIGVYYERYGQQADIEFMEFLMRREHYRFDISPLGGRMSKDDRIRRLQPDFQNGNIYLPSRLPYMTVDGRTVDLTEQFVDEEYKNYPAVDHDDGIDNLARIKDADVSYPNGTPVFEVINYEE